MAESSHIGPVLSLHWHLIGRKRILKILKFGKGFRDVDSVREPGIRRDLSQFSKTMISECLMASEDKAESQAFQPVFWLWIWDGG